jgi:hypothetical protein
VQSILEPKFFVLIELKIKLFFNRDGLNKMKVANISNIEVDDIMPNYSLC